LAPSSFLKTISAVFLKDSALQEFMDFFRCFRHKTELLFKNVTVAPACCDGAMEAQPEAAALVSLA
jgi:hypothetical protein